MDGLKRLVFSGGVSLKNVVARAAGQQAKGFGLYFADSFPSGTAVLRVNRSVWEPYSAAAARTEFCASPAFQSMLDKVGGALGITEEQKGTFEESTCLATKLLSAKDMRMSPYISFLEDTSWPLDANKPVHPLLLPYDSLKLLDHCAAYKGLVSRKQFHSLVGEFFFKAENLPAYLWSMSLVLSRGISGRGYPFTMVPFLDLANHSTRPNAAVQYDEGTGEFRLETIREVAKDEEITISYGDARHNSSVVGLYGFYEEDNMADDLAFSLASSGEADATRVYAGIAKTALNYYSLFRVDQDASTSAEERHEQHVNVCRVVLKDALDKIFTMRVEQGHAEDFVEGVPTTAAELAAVDLMLFATAAKVEQLEIKRTQIENLIEKTISDRENAAESAQTDGALPVNCLHWSETCKQYVSGDLRDNRLLIVLLEDFKKLLQKKWIQ
jgi:hypothetical protein